MKEYPHKPLHFADKEMTQACLFKSMYTYYTNRFLANT